MAMIFTIERMLDEIGTDYYERDMFRDTERRVNKEDRINALIEKKDKLTAKDLKNAIKTYCSYAYQQGAVYGIGLHFNLVAHKQNMDETANSDCFQDADLYD